VWEEGGELSLVASSPLLLRFLSSQPLTITLLVANFFLYQFQKISPPVSFKTALSLFQKIPLPNTAAKSSIYRRRGSGEGIIAHGEQGTRRLVGHWVLLSRFGSNGMGPRVGWWAPSERGPDKI